MSRAWAYYSEWNPHAAAWLRNLIDLGQIAPGEVDERSILDVAPDDLRPFAQCHFFAGIGIWSYALRLAGVPDDAKVWTGSCPCQPFSEAGAGLGFADERHLWPFWHWLISRRRPDRVYGEQVASRRGLEWFDLVQADLQATGYTGAAADICSAGVGAPHIRQRLYFVADADRIGFEHEPAPRLHGRRPTPLGDEGRPGGSDGPRRDDIDRRRAHVRMVIPERPGLEGQRRDGDAPRQRRRILGEGLVRPVAETSTPGRVGDALHPVRRSIGLDREDGRVRAHGGRAEAYSNIGASGEVRRQRPGPTNGVWGAADWLLCTDGFWRPVEPGTFPLVTRTSFDLGHGGAFMGKNRAKMLEGYGNGLNAHQAAAFIAATL